MYNFSKLPTFSNGDEWEEFCHNCLKIKHRDDNYKEVKASSGGDYGIDGFTATGEIYQCYCPEKEYTDKDLYENQRDKITKDIQKLYNNQDKIKALLNGIKIKTWHFTTPSYKNKELILHCNKKENLVKSWGLDFIDSNFKIAITDTSHFRPEISLFFRNAVANPMDFRVPIPDFSTIKNYKEENNQLVKNAKSKNTKLYPQNGIDYSKQIDERTNLTIEAYLIGEKIKKEWSDIFDVYFEKLTRLTSTLEKYIEQQSTLPFDDKVKKIDEIRNMVREKLDIEFSNFLSQSNKEELASAIIADWLMRCPLDFI